MPETFTDFQDAFAFLHWARRDLLTADSDAGHVASGRDHVLATFGSMFRDQPETLTEAEMGSFLDFSENHHWTGLHRQKSAVCSDMPAVREAVRVLVTVPEGDDNVGVRFDKADAMVRGFGEGIITPILFVAFPHKYAVWNRKSEFALQTLGLWPVSLRGLSKGSKYEQINSTIYYVRQNLSALGEEVDLWTIDYYWHAIKVMSDDRRLAGLIGRWRSQASR